MEHVLVESYPASTEDTNPRIAETVRVVLVDTHELLREALYAFIASFPQTQVCASLGFSLRLPEAICQTRAQVVVLGSSVQVSDSLAVLALLKQRQCAPGIIVIQHNLSPEATLTLMRHGVHGLLGEDDSGEDLARAISAAAHSNTFLGRGARNILNMIVSRASTHLTRREMEVLALLKRGETNVRIAQTLGMKEKTVEKHLSHIYSKLNVASRAEAILSTQRLCL